MAASPHLISIALLSNNPNTRPLLLYGSLI